MATLLSVSPHASLLGSYQRLQGAFSMLSYIALFAVVAGNLRQRAQVERLLTVVILTSLPVSLYGIMQRYHRDPLAWGRDTSVRITGTQGNAIFIAAYLMLSTLLIVGRGVAACDILKPERVDHRGQPGGVHQMARLERLDAKPALVDAGFLADRAAKQPILAA